MCVFTRPQFVAMCTEAKQMTYLPCPAGLSLHKAWLPLLIKSTPTPPPALDAGTRKEKEVAGHGGGGRGVSINKN